MLYIFIYIFVYDGYTIGYSAKIWLIKLCLSIRLQQILIMLEGRYTKNLSP